MRSKRLLTMLLAIVMVLSVLSPAAVAVTPSVNSVMNPSTQPEVVDPTNEGNASNKDNDLILSQGSTHGSVTLRDEDRVSVNVQEAESSLKGDGTWTVNRVDADLDLTLKEIPACIEELQQAAEVYSKNEVVAAFVVMEEAPLAETVSSISRVSAADETKMLNIQDRIIDQIESKILKGKELNVRYQFTYLTNSFTIETEFQNLEQIAKMDGVKSVFVMPVYNPCTTDTVDPNTAAAGAMTGVAQVWQNLEYTGSGMKIAVIDTGLDLDHPSFAADPQTTEDSLTVADINAVLTDLNAYAKRSLISGETLYRSAKVPYAFNYCDNNLIADHSSDSQGDHGTHVSGIAAANKTEGTTVVGMAPDAQIIVMKVFGANGGAYSDDIVAALEDAMTLGCDVVNASLGSTAGFTSTDTELDLIYERLASQDIVACISAGNEGTSSSSNMWGTGLNRTQNPDNATVGQPGTYENVMTVASAQNGVVMTPCVILADGTTVFYMDPYQYYPYNLMSYLAEENGGDVEYEYVVIDGLGEAEEFYDAETGESLVEGKIAVIQRGELSFTDKIANAEAAGAVAAIIWDNTSEDIFTFGMQISADGETYPGIATCLISLEDGELLAAAETKTMVVCQQPGERENVSGGQMSSFSSWGVAPDLSLEPDITGIGGNVYSCYDGGGYGLMSGTSMSSPQVAGVTALVMQYVKERYPNAPDGSVRDVTEALLMSTADPIISSDSGVEVSPRQQGAGLVDAYEAVTAEAYLTVNGEKPKAELGDSSTGKWMFSFEIHNISSEDKTYDLSASLLSEAVAGAYGEYFMYGMDWELSGEVSFDKDTITVPAGGKTNVIVTVALSEDDKEMINAYWENGTYVEGYVYLSSADEEGIVEELNLPFLGFYGDWTDAPVFDTAYWYGDGFWGAGDGTVEGDEYYHVLWTNLSGSDWVLGFNPYSGAVTDEDGHVVYDPAHNVVSPNGDGALDGLSEIYLSLLRNAKSLTLTYTVDGEVVDRETVTNVSKTMYNSSYGQVVPWLYSWYGSGMYGFDGLENNTKVILTVDAKVDYGTGGNHTISFPITVDTEAPALVNVDKVEQDGSYYLVLEVSDNVDVAAAFVMNPAGTQIYGTAYDVEMEKTEEGTYLAYFDITNCGTEFMVCVADYGANEGYYEVSYEIEGGNLPEMPTDQLYAYRMYDDHIQTDHMYGWVSVDMDMVNDEYANITAWSDDYMEYAAIVAAEYAGGKIFAVDAVYNLVVMEPGLFNRTTVRNLGVNVVDMTFDDSTDTMYVLSKHQNYTALYTMDLLTGELTLVKDYGYYYYAPYAIADDDNGTIYAIKFGSSVIYTLDAENDYELTAITTTVDDVETEVTIVDSEGNDAYPQYAQSITYLDGILYWAYYKYSWYGDHTEFFAIDTSDWSYVSQAYAGMGYNSNGELIEYYPSTELVGLLSLNETEYTIPESDELTDLVLSTDSLIMPIGRSAQVSASPLPWNYKVESVTWTSEDESVATVVAGRITAVGEGETVIHVYADGFEKEVAVSVVDTDTQFKAYNYYSSDGNYGYMIDVDLGKMSYSLTAEAPTDFIAGDYNGHDGCFYGYSEGGIFWRWNLETDTAEKLGDPVSTLPVDMAYDYSTGILYGAITDYNSGASYIVSVNMNNGAQDVVMDMGYESMLTIAADDEGTVYTVTSEGILYAVDVEAGEKTVVLDNFGTLSYMQSMCWDYENDVLLWACVESATVYWVNVEQGYALSVGNPSSGTFEWIGMHTIPETIPARQPVEVTSVEAADMMMLVDSTKYANVTIRPFNATNQTLVLSSSDESVVKVNANNTLTAVAEGEAEISYALVDGSFSGTFHVSTVTAADNVYGHVMTDLATYGGQYWVRLYTQDPSDPDMLAPTIYTIMSEEYHDGKIYAYGYDASDWEANWQFFVLDAKSYAILSATEMKDGFPFVYDMTYDYSTGTMYAVAGPYSTTTDLYAVDMATGELYLIMNTEPLFITLTAASNGKLYAMENSVEVVTGYDDMGNEIMEYTNAMLYEIDPIAGTCDLVGDSGQKSNMAASLAFDYDTDTIYWTPLFQGAAVTSGLCMVDRETGVATNLGGVGTSGAQIVGLYILSDSFPEDNVNELQGLIMDTNNIYLSHGDSTAISAVTLPMSLSGEIVWSTSDDTVATVDSNGVVTGVNSGMAVITASVTHGGKTLEKTCSVLVLDEDDGYLTYDTTVNGWANVNRCTGEATLLTQDEEVSVAAVEYVNGTIYGVDVNNGLFTLNTDTYERTMIGYANSDELIDEYLVMIGYEPEQIKAEHNNYAFEIRDIAYDNVGDRMLVLGNVYDAMGYELYYGNSVYEMDLTTGTLTKLYTITDVYYVMSLAVGSKGEVFYYNAFNDDVTKLDLEKGEETILVSLQNQGVYGEVYADHAMHYDALTDSVYLLFTANGSSYMMYAMDPSTGRLNQCLETVGESTYAGLTTVERHYHSFGAWVLEKEPSSAEEGVLTRSCACGEHQTKTIAKLVNKFTDVSEKEYYFEAVLWGTYRGITAGATETTFEPEAEATRAQMVTFLWRAAGEPVAKTTVNPFTDVSEKEYCYDAVLWAYENGITAGATKTTFEPDLPCTRAQAVSFLYRAFGEGEKTETKNPFTDVSTKSYYYDAVMWAVEHNVTAGMTKTVFGPDVNCTRAQIMSFLYRLLHV